MLATKIPYLYCRNGIYYYRNQSIWKSLKTRCKKEAFRKLSLTMYGTTPALKDTSIVIDSPSIKASGNKLTPNDTTSLIKAYLAENGTRWCAREYTRIESSLGHLPRGVITREVAIQLKASLLKIKSVTSFNRYLKYFNALYRWGLANNILITENPFEGLRVIEKKKSISQGRNAYTSAQLKELFEFADKYGKSDRRFWLIMIGRYTGARMNEICQLKPEDITEEVIHIRGDVLKTGNAKRTIPIHSKLIELGILEWVSSCNKDRLFYAWKPIKGSYSHQASRWFSRNSPFKSKVKGQKASIDFHSLRHTVATELKVAGIATQFAVQILGHSNGNITYDRYGKDIDSRLLVIAMETIG